MIIGNAVIAAGASSGETEEKTVTITENGTQEVTPTEGKTMTKVTVQTNVPVPTLEASKEVTYTENGTFTIEPSEGKDAIEEVSVTVNVPPKTVLDDSDWVTATTRPYILTSQLNLFHLNATLFFNESSVEITAITFGYGINASGNIISSSQVYFSVYNETSFISPSGSTVYQISDSNVQFPELNGFFGANCIKSSGNFSLKIHGGSDANSFLKLVQFSAHDIERTDL